MIKKLRGRGLMIACVLLMLLSAMPTLAQDAPVSTEEAITEETITTEEAPIADVETLEPPVFEPLHITLEAGDGATLHGYYFAHSDAEGRAVLLLHQFYSTHESWSPLIYPLMDAGYKVLAVDLRGHGATRAKLNWTAAQADTLLWAEWLKNQPGVTAVAMGGSSMGSSLALVGCAAFEGCLGAVAISPGLNYHRVYAGDAIQDGYPALLIYADRDPYPRRDVPEMQTLGGEAVEVLLYSGRAHGVELFKTDETLAAQIVAWIAAR